MRERQFGLGQADEIDGLVRRHGHRERLRVGQPDVLRGEDHEAAGDEPRVLASREHLGEPVHRRIGIAAAAALDERRDRVVVLVFVRIVPDAALAREGLQLGRG